MQIFKKKKYLNLKKKNYSIRKLDSKLIWKYYVHNSK